MAFLVYFLVLVVMGGSIMFGLDWENAPLHGPAKHEQTTTGMQARSQHRPAVANASAAARRAQIAAAVGTNRPEPVTQQQPQAASTAAPQAASTAVPAEQITEQVPTPRPKPELVAQHEPPAAAPPDPPERPQAAAAMPAKSEPAAQHAQQELRTGSGASTEHPTAGETAENHKAVENRKTVTKRSQSHRASAQAPSSAQAQPRRHEDRRQTAREEDQSVPSWAIRGAEAARSEAGREEHAAGREEHARAPSWAIRGAQAADREADDDAQPRETYRSSWQSGPGWHFGWQ